MSPWKKICFNAQVFFYMEVMIESYVNIWNAEHYQNFFRFLDILVFSNAIFWLFLHDYIVW